MSGQITIESPPSAMRRQPLLTTPDMSSTPKNGRKSRQVSRIGEAAGECAAVWCCCPCAMMHLLVLAVYRVPTGLWKKKKRKRLLKKKRKLSSKEDTENQRRRNDEEESTDGEDSTGVDNDVFEWENEMLDRFYGAGFWRSGSQRSDADE